MPSYKIPRLKTGGIHCTFGFIQNRIKDHLGLGKLQQYPEQTPKTFYILMKSKVQCFLDFFFIEIRSVTKPFTLLKSIY